MCVRGSRTRSLRQAAAPSKARVGGDPTAGGRRTWFYMVSARASGFVGFGPVEARAGALGDGGVARGIGKYVHEKEAHKDDGAGGDREHEKER